MRRSINFATWIVVAALGWLPLRAISTNELNDALRRKPNREHGRVLYETCAACHQPDGGGVAEGDIPNIAGQHYRVILRELTDFRDTERLDLRMESFAS